MWRNRSATFRYLVYGAVFGLVFPILSTAADLLAHQLPFTLDSIIQIQAGNPLHWVIDSAPLFLGLFAAAAGQRQDRILEASREAEQEAQKTKLALRQVEAMQASLEREVAERTANLTTVIEVGRAAASILELSTLARQVADLVRQRFDLYYVGLFLLDKDSGYAVLEAGTGEAGRAMREQRHRLAVGGRSMVGAACAERQARIAMDVGEEAIRFDNPLLPDTRSEAALPLVVGDRVLGALDVQSVRPAAFSSDDVAVLQLVANQVAVAVDNAQKFSEEARLLEAASPLFRASRRLAAAVTTEEIVRAITSSVAETEADGCLVGRLDSTPEGEIEKLTFLGDWHRHGASRLPDGVSFSVGRSPLPPEVVVVPMTSDDVARDTEVPPGLRSFLATYGSRGFFNVPLRVGDRPIGFVSIHRSEAGPFPPVAVRLYETFADQAAVALERSRLLDEARARAMREQAASEATARLREALEVEAVLQTAAKEISGALGLAALDVRLAMDWHAGDDGGVRPE